MSLPPVSKPAKILSSYLTGGERRERGFWFSWDHWRAARWFLWPTPWIAVQKHKLFLNQHAYHSRFSHIYTGWSHPWVLGFLYFFSSKNLTTVILLSGQLYIQPLTSQILNLSFQILVEPLARLLDTRKKNNIVDSTWYSHLPWAAAEWHMSMSAKLRRKWRSLVKLAAADP